MTEICTSLHFKAAAFASKSNAYYRQNASSLPPQRNDSDIRHYSFYFQSKSLCFSFIFYTFAHAERKCYKPNCKEISIDNA